MLVTSQFKVDLFQMKHTKDPEGLLQAVKDKYAREFGKYLIEQFPFEKVRGFEGELPEMSLNKEHEFTDTYERVLVVSTVQDARKILAMFETYSGLGKSQEYFTVRTLLGL